MSDFKLALTYLRSRLLITALTALSVALGLGLATMVLALSRQTTDMLSHETANWDVVVGAKGSPLQLVLNGLYYLDAPTGNISGDIWKHLQEDPAVAAVVPLNMGDSYFGVPIIGTVPEFFAGRQPARGELIAKGHQVTKPFEAVIGADIAARYNLPLGKEFCGSHGWSGEGEEHKDSPYTVVGILAPTGSSLDRAIYTDYRSIWEGHAHHEHEDGDGHHDEDEHAHGNNHEVTSLLVRLHQLGRRDQFVDGINRQFHAMAVIPVYEISKVATQFIAPLQGILLVVAYLVVLVSALSILISLYLTIHQRQRDLGILRSLGATRTDVFRLITLEAAMLSGLGVLIGWLVGHGALAAISPFALSRFGVTVHAWQVQPVEFIIAASVWVLGVLAGLLPAAIAYRLPVADTLVKE